jgi:uncharacterized membrane protein
MAGLLPQEIGAPRTVESPEATLHNREALPAQLYSSGDMKRFLVSLLHRSFQIGITIKGIDGVFEAIGGILLWFVKPAALNSFVRTICLHELSRDPHDFIAAQVMHMSERLAAADPLFASLYLLSHGIVKIALVVAMWFNQLWAYSATIVVFGAFTAYEFYRFIHRHSNVLGVLSVLDAVVVLLTWREYLRQRAEHQAHAPRSPEHP